MPGFQTSPRARQARRLLGAALGRPLLGPQVISLETTHHCNLRCSFCESHGALQPEPITSRRRYAGGRMTMDLETIRRLAGEMAEVETDLVELSGKGDPIAHPQLTEIIRILHGAGLGCALVTNATLASPNLAAVLVETGLARLSVSLNAGSRETYLQSNKRDLWDRAISFLEQVLAERRARNARRPWTRISHVVTRENVADFDAMVEICRRLRVDEALFYVLGELPETTSLRLDAADVAFIDQGITEWGRRLDEAGVIHSLPVFAQELRIRTRNGLLQENSLQRSLPCYEGWMFCVIAPDGTVSPCCYCEDRVLGNVHEQSFADIWYGALYRQFRRHSLEMPQNGRWICRECFTSCCRGVENRRIHNRIHPLSKIPMVAEPATPSL